MSKYKIKEFAKAYGIKESTVKSYVHRGQLQKDADHYIDTEIDKNKLFIMEMELKVATNKVEKVADDKPSRARRVSEDPTGLNKIQKEFADIELRKKRADLDLVERGAELKRIQLEKAAGNLLPVDLVERVLVINLQSIIKSFDTELENISNVLVERFGGSRKDLVEITKEQRDILGRIIAKAKKDAEFEIENAINDFQDNRGRGERKT